MSKADAESYSTRTGTLSRQRLGGKTMSFHAGRFKSSVALGIRIDRWGIGIDLILFWIGVEW